MTVASLERRIAPSILACDFGRFADEVRDAEAAGAPVLHLDVMDGHFVPNISFGPGVVAAVNRATDLPLDVHLMIAHPTAYLDDYLKAGADLVSVHVEAAGDTTDQLARIRDAGAQTGLAISPDTPLDRARPWLDAGAVDLLVVMTVYPGFGGQRLIAACLDKVRAARADYPELAIEVDGGVNLETIDACRDAGASLFVAGSAFFRPEDRAATHAALAARLSPACPPQPPE